MADVRLSIANRSYTVTCKDGEEPHLQALGIMVDDMARQVGGGSGSMNEGRLLLFSALLLADKLHDSNGASSADKPQPDVDQATKTLEKLADRLEVLADKLEQ